MKRAETIAEVGVLPLSRRDRAAMELALEAVRVCVCALDARIVDEFAGDAIEVARCALKCASAWCVAGELCEELRYARRRVPPRLLRARLALALRVLLRVDTHRACDRRRACCVRHRFAPHPCPYEKHYGPWIEDGNDIDRDEWPEPRRFAPLWESAPPHDGRSAKERPMRGDVEAVSRDAVRARWHALRSDARGAPSAFMRGRGSTITTCQRQT